MSERRDPGSGDDEARRRIRYELDQTLFVEAGAGTGKTTALVARIVELIATGTAPLRHLAAITFTEAAAGELRDRIRERLELLADGQGDGDDEPARPDHERGERLERIDEALTELDAAAISTLHGFAQRILAEHPFEAGLPPTFEVYDQIRSRVAFDERWGAFLDELLDTESARPALERALVSGVTLAHLRSIALEFNRNWDLVADHEVTSVAAEPVDATPVLSALETAAQLADGCADPDDRLARHIRGLAGWSGRLADAHGDLDRLQLLAQAPRLAKGSGGRKANWGDRIEEPRQALGEAQRARDEILLRAFRQALGELLVAIQALTLRAADERRRDGSLEFHDLLVQARLLLRTHPEVTAQLHDSYRCLLIDEFQDTDPIQIELAVRIATDHADPAVPWNELSVPPGRLFFVGDPKQAIYRFRRADIGLFLEVRDAQARAAESLTRNHRSVPGVLDWVNAVFAELMGDGDPGAQPAYEALIPHRPPAAVSDPAAPSAPPVLLLGGPIEGQPISRIRTTEAEDLATTIQRVRDEGWAVGTDARPARLADVCVLIPTRTSLPALERALEDHGLPYRVESSSLVYASSEVRDLLNVLRAVDDPTAEVAVVAALRSAWFGCGDDDLYDFHAAGGRWDYRRDLPESLPTDHPVAVGLAALRHLHDQRWWHDASGLIEKVLVDRRVYELGLDERRPRDVWRRLHFVLDQAREFTDAYGADLRRYLAWADLQAADDARVVEAILPETDDDAVRIMTVHASKGLEFPVVVLSGLNTEYRPRANGVDVLWSPQAIEVKLIKSLDTAGYVELAEREQRIDEHEQIRLLYVAATRARDHLIVSLHHKDRPNVRCHAAALDRLAAATAGLWRRLDADQPAEVAPTGSATQGQLAFPTQAAQPTKPSPPPTPPPSPLLDDVDLEVRQAWIARRSEALAAAARPSTLAATSVARLAREASDDESARPASSVDTTPWRRGRAGTAVGRAVHGTLQLIDLTNPVGLEAVVRSQCGAEGVADRTGEVEQLVRAALAAPIVAEAAAAGRYWREVYVGAPVAGRGLEGFIDLLIEGPDGLVVVDYKTDRAPADEDLDRALDRYRLQGASYAVALEATLDRPVARCVFLFLRGGMAVERELVDLDQAKRDVVEVLARP